MSASSDRVLQAGLAAPFDEERHKFSDRSVIELGLYLPYGRGYFIGRKIGKQLGQPVDYLVDRTVLF